MWIFTRYGFYSTVCARQGDGKHGRPVDENRMMVRARSREQLQALIERFPEELADRDVKDTGHTDYRYRIFVAKDAWRRVADALVEEIDYDNFKAAAARHTASGGYEGALHDVWEVMHRLQRGQRE